MKNIENEIDPTKVSHQNLDEITLEEWVENQKNEIKGPWSIRGYRLLGIDIKGKEVRRSSLDTSVRVFWGPEDTPLKYRAVAAGILMVETVKHPLSHIEVVMRPRSNSITIERNI